MKKSLSLIFAVLSFFMISTAMAQTCLGNKMAGGDVCFTTGGYMSPNSTVFPIFTIAVYDNLGWEYGWSSNTFLYPLGQYMAMTGATSITQFNIAQSGQGPVNVTNSIVAQCGATIDTKHTYKIHVVVNAPSGSGNSYITCTKQLVG